MMIRASEPPMKARRSSLGICKIFDFMASSVAETAFGSIEYGGCIRSEMVMKSIIWI